MAQEQRKTTTSSSAAKAGANTKASARPASDAVRSSGAAEKVVVESGVDRSRKAAIVPDHMLIQPKANATGKIPGGARFTKSKAAREAERGDVEDDQDLRDEIDSEEDTGFDQDAGEEDAGEEAPVNRRRYAQDDEQPEDDAGEEVVDEVGDAESDDELLDVILNDSGQGRGEANQEKADDGNTLRGAYLDEYNAIAEQYGPELADRAFKPRLLREQAIEAALQPLLQERVARQNAELARARQTTEQFFSGKASTGFAKLYGSDPSKASKTQQLAMQRTIEKAIEYRKKAEAVGVEIQPVKLLERAHKALWGNTDIAKTIQSTQKIMHRRSENISMPSRRGARVDPERGGGNAGGEDKYAKVRQALIKSGHTDR